MISAICSLSARLQNNARIRKILSGQVTSLDGLLKLGCTEELGFGRLSPVIALSSAGVLVAAYSDGYGVSRLARERSAVQSRLCYCCRAYSNAAAARLVSRGR